MSSENTFTPGISDFEALCETFQRIIKRSDLEIAKICKCILDLELEADWYKKLQQNHPRPLTRSDTLLADLYGRISQEKESKIAKYCEDLRNCVNKSSKTTIIWNTIAN